MPFKNPPTFNRCSPDMLSSPPLDEHCDLTYQPNTRGFRERTLPPSFDYSNNGIVFLQDGTLFYSPNCSRLAIITANLPQTSPLHQRT